MSWALLLATVRRLPRAFEAARQGRWDCRKELRGRQLSNMTLGILGYGRLGTIVARYGVGFGMRVLACDVRPATPAEGVRMVDFDTLLRESDVLSIHVHLNDQTRGLIGREELKRMKPGAVLVNTSRGGLIDEPALIEALASGWLSGAGLDVIDGEYEPDLRNHPLVRYANEHENLVLSPHIAGATWDSQRMTLDHMVRKLRDYLRDLPQPSHTHPE
jgi:phosphoglycerate dehydrogenase-like enzyme